MIVLRVIIVVALLFLLALARRLYLGWRHDVRTVAPPVPPVPASLLDGAERTWVLFTTPWCASCGQVEEELRAREPESRLVKVDATREPYLADAFHVRAAPTVLLADGTGEVRARLVGVDAVRGYVANAV